MNISHLITVTQGDLKYDQIYWRKKKKKQNKTQLGTDVLFKNYWKY